MSRLSIGKAATAALALTFASMAPAYQKTPPSSPPPAASAAPAASPKPAPKTKLVDLNLASRTELQTLPGIGDAEAAKIVAARPYKSKTDLVTRNVLTLEAYDRLSKQVVVDLRKPPAKPKS
jgi:DNA uptake protein ComE-like DNA-binding protein